MPVFNLFAQEHDALENSEDLRWEAIVSGIYSYSFEEEETVFGNEFHLTYWITHKWGTGLSYTLKYEDDEILHDIAVLGSWNPVKWMTCNTGPNFEFEGEHRDFGVSFYFELEFNIRLTHWFHFGPIAGTLLGGNSEISTGMHIGFEF